MLNNLNVGKIGFFKNDGKDPNNIQILKKLFKKQELFLKVQGTM